MCSVTRHYLRVISLNIFTVKRISAFHLIAYIKNITPRPPRNVNTFIKKTKKKTLSSLRMAAADAACGVGTPLNKKKERKKRNVCE